MVETEKKYDLEERTAKFGEQIIVFCRSVKEDTVTRPLINQLVRSGTSVGANYMEANGASSKKDFKNKIFICKKEAQESMHWLRMFISCIDDKNRVVAEKLKQEAKELSMIFHTIASKTV